MPNKKPTQAEQDARFVEMVHTSLDSYPVLIFNGQTDPVTKTLPEAFLSISSDMRDVKGDVKEAKELLHGAKHRRDIRIYFVQFVEAIAHAYKLKPIFKIFATIVGAIVTIAGTIKIVEGIIGLFN